MRDPQGRAYQMYEDAVEKLERDGWWKMTPSEIRDEESRRSSDVVNSEERRHLWYGVVGIGGAMIVMLWLLKPWRYFRAG